MATADEVEIRQLIDTLLQAIRDCDLDGVKPVFAPDVVSFDIQPPLKHVGAVAKWRNWADVFAVYQRPIGYETRDLTVTVGGDVAFAYNLNRISGTRRDGQQSAYWVRWTSCLAKIDGAWLIVHDQVSVPTDMATGRALLDLTP